MGASIFVKLMHPLRRTLSRKCESLGILHNTQQHVHQCKISHIQYDYTTACCHTLRYDFT